MAADEEIRDSESVVSSVATTGVSTPSRGQTPVVGSWRLETVSSLKHVGVSLAKRRAQSSQTARSPLPRTIGHTASCRCSHSVSGFGVALATPTDLSAHCSRRQVRNHVHADSSRLASGRRQRRSVDPNADASGVDTRLSPDCATSLAAVNAALDRGAFDVALVDLALGAESGLRRHPSHQGTDARRRDRRPVGGHIARVRDSFLRVVGVRVRAEAVRHRSVVRDDRARARAPADESR